MAKEMFHPGIFRLWRQDDLGNQNPMPLIGSNRCMESLRKFYQDKNHGQFYFVRENLNRHIYSR